MAAPWLLLYMVDAKLVHRFSTKSCESWESPWMNSENCVSWVQRIAELLSLTVSHER
jgi:hypothetical protein